MHMAGVLFCQFAELAVLPLDAFVDMDILISILTNRNKQAKDKTP
jgi:hypothetical protein